MNTKKFENMKSWTEAEVTNFERMLKDESESVAREMDEQANMLRAGRKIYSTDAQNMLGRMNRLYELQSDLDAAIKRMELLNTIEEE